MNEESPQDKEAAFAVAVFASISLAIMTLEYLWLIRDEYNHVWPRLRRSWTAWIYMSSRYLGLASQVFNVYFTVRMYHGIPTSAAGCRFWFMFQAVVIQFLLACVEGLLMHRVYALFPRNKLVLSVLIMFICGQMASMWVSAKLSFPTNEYTSTCLMVRSNPGGAFFSATTMTTNVVIFVMTFGRCLWLPLKWKRTGLGWTVFRDTTLTLGAISLTMLFLTLCSLNVIKPHTSGNSTYYWFVAILWIAIGRIIVNHEKLRQDLDEQFDSTWDGMLQITSHLELGEQTLVEERMHTGTPNGRVDDSPSTSASQTPSSSPSSISGQMWLGDSPQLDGPRRGPRPRVRPELYLDIPVTKENELSPWGDCASDEPWQVVALNAKLPRELFSAGTSQVEPSGERVDDELQTQDVTDAWRDQFADGLDSPALSPLELSPSDATS